MPDQPAGGEVEPTEAVKAHLQKSNVHANELHGEVIKALNKFSETEITKLDNLGTAFEDEHLDTNLRISAVH